MTDELRAEFRNESPGVQGVVLYDADGKRTGSFVRPGQSVWLSEREQVATANAPRRAEDNPFVNGALILITEAHEVVNRRPIGSRAQIVDEEGRELVDPPAGPFDPRTAGRSALEDQSAPPPVEVKPGAPEEVGAPPLPEGDPEHGIRQPGEEVGTPDAVPQGSGRRKGAAGTVVR